MSVADLRRDWQHATWRQRSLFVLVAAVAVVVIAAAIGAIAGAGAYGIGSLAGLIVRGFHHGAGW